MYKKTTYKFKPIYILGDLHSNLSWLIYHCKQYDIKDCTIIQVGDFGVGFIGKDAEQNRLDFLNDFCAKRNIKLLAIRGNHDDPEYFKDNHYYSNLMLLSDYTVLTINDLNFLFVGGAISIDRKVRTAEKDYWTDEGFVLDEEKLANLDKKIDVVITHNAPAEVSPIGLNGLVHSYAKDDTMLYQELPRERNMISKMLDMLLFNGHPLKFWTYGHFHFSSTEEYKGVKFTLLGISEFKELKS